ncbi:MAG: chromate transporter [Lachnospiraceae bacterium]|nr:chromate transporter [Lachnospiraceae bacterium]
MMDLFLSFFKIGLFTFGGGYAMIPLIEKEAVENKKWLSGEELLDIIAIAESTPGPIAVNAATFIGKKIKGFAGALCATAGVVLPSFIIILIVSFFWEKFKELRVVRYAFWGIRAGVLALIAKALVSMFMKSSKDLLSYFLMGASAVAVIVFDINAIIVILCCALIGLVYTIR